MIVHGQTHLLTEVIARLVLKGFKEDIQMARLEMAGNVGDYVGMVGKMCNKMNYIEYL